MKSKTRQAFIEAGGNLCRRLGLPRTVGQIYGLLYLSPKALSLEEIAAGLNISKASASTGTRQLASLGAIRQVWVPGNRKDHFEAIPEISGLLRNAYREMVKPRLDASEQRVERLLVTLDDDLDQGLLDQDEFDFCRKRIQSLTRIQKALKSLAPLLEKFL